MTSSIELSVNTPRSKEDRKIKLSYFVDNKRNSMEAELATPWKNLLVKGILSFDNLDPHNLSL